ncbi:unnamed protein product [Rotaria sp. Silwood1]|nr:unnamed protein product [Rotaria sp. Silwood1]
MQVEGQQQEDFNAITHSPYYGCTVRVLSKAHVSYEGILDGISANKDRIYLKNVRVNASITDSFNRNSPSDDSHKNISTDTLNAVMIDHLTNDIHIYEQVCLNVRDIQELKLIELPSTFHESKAKLRAIDPCLVDIRLSSSDEYETRSNGSNPDHPPRAPIARQSRGESFGSNGDSALISSDSNDSSASFHFRPNEKFPDESNDESLDEQIHQLSQLITTTNINSKPVTLLAKKVLPKKIDRRSDIQSTSSINTNNNVRQIILDNHEIIDTSIPINNHNTLKKESTVNDNRISSPIRVTITSQLNPNATPFFTQQRHTPGIQNSSFTFYERPRFRPRLQPVTSPDRSQSLPYGINAIDNNNNHHHHQQQQQQQNYNHSNQRYVSQRQLTGKKNYTQTNPPRTTKTRPIRTPPPTAKYRIHASTCMDKRFFSQPQYKDKTQNNPQYRQIPGQTSVPTSSPPILTPPIPNRPLISRNNPSRRSTASVRSTLSLPYQYGCSSDRNQMQTPVSFQESIGSHRNQRTVSGASSCSSVSVDIGPHSIIQFDSSSNIFPSFDEQYDFEKANEEFRRYLELEELVKRRSSLQGSPSDENTIQQQQQQQQQPQSYKKDISFFDHISCTATTGTAVGYTEMDETEKNLETFGNDALLMASSLNDNEWQI